MEGVLPFEYGFMYKPIESLKADELANITDGIQIDFSGNPSYFSNSGMMGGYVSTQGIDASKYFHPIAYVSSKQKVIAEVMVREEEKTNGHFMMSGMSFQTTDLTKRYIKINRAEIDVNVFIKNFEKVL